MRPLYYPIFVSLKERLCLVVGGGSVGERKVRVLLHYGAAIRLIARKLSPWLKAQCDAGRIEWLGTRYGVSSLEGVDLVFAATSDAELNRTIAREAAQRRLWCNMATDPEEGSFIVPSIVEQGPLTVAISTGGLSPAVAKRVRGELEQRFGPEWGFFLELLGRLRAEIQAKELASEQNQEIFRRLAALPIPEMARAGERTRAVAAIHDICKPWLGTDELNLFWDEAWKRFSWSSPPCAIVAEPSAT